MIRSFTTLVALLPGAALAFHAVSMDGQFTRWPSNSMHYVVDATGSDDFRNGTGCDDAGPCISLRRAIRRSFANWESPLGTRIDFIEDPAQEFGASGYDGRNVVTFVETSWDQLAFVPPPGAIAVTITTYTVSSKQIVDSDIHLNGEYYRWAVIDSPQEESNGVIDVENILTHEIGHFIGLGHSSEDIFESNQELSLATMFFASGAGETLRRDLALDDRYGARNLYPAIAPPSPEISSSEAQTFDVWTTPEATLHLAGRNLRPFTSAVLVLGGGREDIPARITSVDDTSIDLSFAIARVPNGTYDVVIANSFDRLTRIPGLVTVTGNFAASTDVNTGRDPSMGGDSGGCRMSGGATGLTFLGILFLLASWRSRRRQRNAPRY